MEQIEENGGSPRGMLERTGKLEQTRFPKGKEEEEEKEGIGRDAVGYRDDKWRQKARENL